MKSRGITLLVTALVLWGIFFSAIGNLFACQMTMPVNCPVRSVRAAAAAPVETHACCAAKNKHVFTVAPENLPTFKNACCCEFRASDAVTDQPVVLVVTDSPVFLPPVQSVLTIPAAVAIVVAPAILRDSDAPRGPPRAALSPRAPPAFS